MDLLDNTVSAAIGGLCVAVVDAIFLRRYSHLAERVDVLEREKIAKLEQVVEKHLNEDQSQKIIEKLDTLGGSVNRLADRVDRALETNAAQQSSIGEHEHHLRSIDVALIEHTKIYHNPRR